jgi:hypothetical protein
MYEQKQEGFCGPPRRDSQDGVHGPMGVSGYELAIALNFPGIYEVVRGLRLTLRFAWQNISVCRRSSGSICKMTTISECRGQRRVG